MTSDAEFHDFFGHEIFHEILHEIFLKYFKNFTMFFPGFTLTRSTFLYVIYFQHILQKCLRKKASRPFLPLDGLLIIDWPGTGLLIYR